jgi:hypothetical protein
MSTTPIPLPQEADIAVPQKGTTVSETGTPDFGPIVGHFNVSSHVAGVKKAYDEIVQHARNARSSLAGKLNEAVIKHVPNFDTMPPEVQNDVRTAVSQGLGFYSGGLLESAPAMAPSDVEHPMTSTVPPVGGPKSIVEGEGLVYKGELSPESDRHMVEHQNHPGKTATFEGPVTAEKARAEVNRKLNEFGVDPNVPETARQYIERSKGPVKDFSALPGHEERLSAEEQFKKEMFEDAKTSPDFRGLGPTGVGGLGANIEEPVAPGRATEGDKPAFYENKPLYEGPTGEKFDFGSLKEHQEIKPAKVKQAAVPPTVREGYYNTIEHVVQNKLGNSFTPEQLHATLKNAGVPKQEMENLGINDPEKLSYKLANRSGKLPSERDTLTKQEVLDHLDRNRLQLDVVEHAEGTVPPEYQKLKDEESQLLVDRQNLSHRIALANDELLSGELGHAAYQDKNNEFNELKQRQDKVLNRLGDVRNTMDNFKPQPGNVEHTKYGQYTLPGGTNYREVLLQKRGEEPESGEAYESPHFDEPNILAHLRLKDRVDTSGKKTLFMEEAQSDWAHDATPEAREQQRQDYAPEDYEEGSPHVPRFPLGSDWHELALKHALKEAVDGGYDQLSWTTGQQQAERYNLAKAVDHLIYDDKIEQLSGLKNGKLVVNDFVAPEDLHKYVGKDLAKQLTSTPITSEGEFGINRHNLHITETTIGGEKHKALYDRMIPQFLNKYTKRWGGKVGTTEIEVPEHNPTDPDDPWGGGNTNIVNPKSKVTVHTLPITPELREAVQKGQPMFGAGIKEPAPSRGP